MKLDKGFTTVELVVTLFVLSIFLFGGYQLYQAVILRGNQARRASEASNIAYEVLRSEGKYVTTTQLCSSASHFTQNITRTTNLPKPVNIVLSRCRVSGDSQLIRVSVKLTYGNPQEEVVHALLLAEAK